MGYKFNPFTGKLDNAGVVASSLQPQSGSGAPEGSIAARYAGDIYVDTATDIAYINGVSGATTGRQVIQSSPGL